MRERPFAARTPPVGRLCAQRGASAIEYIILIAVLVLGIIAALEYLKSKADDALAAEARDVYAVATGGQLDRPDQRQRRAGPGGPIASSPSALSADPATPGFGAALGGLAGADATEPVGDALRRIASGNHGEDPWADFGEGGVESGGEGELVPGGEGERVPGGEGERVPGGEGERVPGGEGELSVGADPDESETVDELCARGPRSVIGRAIRPIGPLIACLRARLLPPGTPLPPELREAILDRGLLGHIADYVDGYALAFEDDIRGTIELAHGVWNILPIRAIYDYDGWEESVRNFESAANALVKNPSLLVDALFGDLIAIGDDWQNGRKGNALGRTTYLFASPFQILSRINQARRAVSRAGKGGRVGRQRRQRTRTRRQRNRTRREGNRRPPP